MKNLDEIKIGSYAKIISFDKGISKCDFERFALSEGCIIKCIAKIGPVIVRENNQTVAIGKSLAKKIFVEELEKR